MEKQKSLYFALGIAFTLGVVGCMVAASDAGNANTGWRYELIPTDDVILYLDGDSPPDDGLIVFDRETGTVNVWDNEVSEQLVFVFSQNPPSN